MKPFDIKLAKAGHKIRTRDGRPVRIMCYDLISTSGCTIGALINNGTYEGWTTYSEDGKKFPEDGNTNSELVMASTKKEGWINLYRSSLYMAGASNVYETEEEALKGKDEQGYITTTKIEWEE